MALGPRITPKTHKLLNPFLMVIGLLVLFALFLLLDVNKIFGLMVKANAFFLLLALVLSFAAVFVKSVKWRQFFYDKKGLISISESTEIFFKGFFLSILTPGRVGDFARALFVKGKLGFVMAFVSVVLDRLVDVFLLFFFSLALLVAFFGLFGFWVLNPWIVLAVLALGGFGFLYFSRRTDQGFFRKLIFLFVPEKYRGKAGQGYRAFVHGLRARLVFSKSLLLAVLLGIGSWVFSFGLASCVGWSLGINQSIYFFAFVVSILALTDIIPVGIGGLGTREAVAVLLFSAVGVGAETAIAFSLLYFVIAYLAPAILGGLLFLKRPLSL